VTPAKLARRGWVVVDELQPPVVVTRHASHATRRTEPDLCLTPTARFGTDSPGRIRLAG
jgi:hypothetical protein